MKLLLATLLLAMTAAAPAAASSFVLLKRADKQISPSIIMFVEPDQVELENPQELLGGPAPEAPEAPAAIYAVPLPERYVRVSASIIAMGEPAVETTIVASITPEEKPMRNPHLPPMVIRGGIFGAAFPRGDGFNAPVVEAPAQEVATTPAETPGQAPGQQQQPEAPRAPPPPQPQAPAAPTRPQE